MPAILILYSTVDGHTLTICRTIKERVERSGHTVTLASIEDAGTVAPKDFDKVVIGASIRYGKHRQSVFDFIETNRRVLDAVPTAFFSVNIVARKAEKSRPETNPYVRKFLARTSWRPTCLAVFAGRLDYPHYRFFDRQMIRFIMWITKGPTDPSTVIEYTDWRAVDAFAREICAIH